MKFTPFDEIYECRDESYPDFGWSPATNFNEAPASEKCPSSTSQPNPAPTRTSPPSPAPTTDNDDDLVSTYYDNGCSDLPSDFCSNQYGTYCKDYQRDECDRSICHSQSHAELNACPPIDSDDESSAPVSSPVSAPVTAPTPSAPVTSPVSAPVTAPASAPVSQPTNQDNSYCQDSADIFLFKGKNNKNCRWIGRTKTEARCRDSAAAEHCPVTCKNANCTCFDSDDFMLGDKRKDCEWVAKKLLKRCDGNLIRSNCPITCGVCE